MPITLISWGKHGMIKENTVARNVRGHSTTMIQLIDQVVGTSAHKDIMKSYS